MTENIDNVYQRLDLAYDRIAGLIERVISLEDQNDALIARLYRIQEVLNGDD